MLKQTETDDSIESNCNAMISRELLNATESNENSITSINSVGSLLREKLQVLPTTLRIANTKRDYKTRIFVGFLFVAVIVLILFAYFVYDQQVVQREYFDNMKLNKMSRVLKIYNTVLSSYNGGNQLGAGNYLRRFGSAQVTRIELGKLVHLGHTVLPCLPGDPFATAQQNSLIINSDAVMASANRICLEWIDKARLHLSYSKVLLYSSGSQSLPTTNLFPFDDGARRSTLDRNTTTVHADSNALFSLAPRSGLIDNASTTDAIHCYNLVWQSLADHIWPTDCIRIPVNSHWYGGGQSIGSAWPLERTHHHDFVPFITGRVEKHQWGNALRRFFIGSQAVAILIDDGTPLHVAITAGTTSSTVGHNNNNNNNRNVALCLRGRFDSFAYVHHTNKYPHLNYTICSASSMTKLHSFLTKATLWDGLKQEDIGVIDALLTEPVWEITSSNRADITEETVSNYTEDVISLGFLKQGHVLLNEFWQREMGDLTVDTDRFATLRDSIDVMHRRGFRIAVTVQPYISTESVNFAECVRKRLLITERASDRRIPALTRYKSAQSAAMLDITNVNRTVPWLLHRLKTLLAKYKFDAFYLDMGTAHQMPHYYQWSRPLSNPDQYKTQFVHTVIQANLKVVAIGSAVERPPAPIFLSLPPFESSWTGLRQVIPTVLQYGLVGYPFLIPSAVGGDIDEHIMTTSSSSSSLFVVKPSAATVLHIDNHINNATRHIRRTLPDKELYIRWLQMATFLPVIRYRHLPNKYGDESILDLVKILTVLRQNKVSPLLKVYAKIALDTGLPLVRPLWMVDSNDPACHTVQDEFAIGDELIVAPVLYASRRQREVYLPAGVWKDGIDGSLRKGNRWLHDYRVDINQVAYFERMPDNTRF